MIAILKREGSLEFLFLLFSSPLLPTLAFSFDISNLNRLLFSFFILFKLAHPLHIFLFFAISWKAYKMAFTKTYVAFNC